MELKRLREIREENKLTQKEVAASLNIATGTYAMNETGHDTITLDNLVKFCDILNISVDYILELSSEKKPSNIKGYNKEILKTRLKENRKNAHYTQEQIGKILNIDHSVWCRYEKGVTTINTTFLSTFCHTLNVSADYLLGRI